MPYDNSNQGMLARNERKQQENYPDFTGQCEVGGIQYWISGWTKEGKPGWKMEGKRFFSLAFKPKDAAPQQAPRLAQPAAVRQAPAAQPKPQPAPAPQTNLEEDVPF